MNRRYDTCEFCSSRSSSFRYCFNLIGMVFTLICQTGCTNSSTEQSATVTNRTNQPIPLPTVAVTQEEAEAFAQKVVELANRSQFKELDRLIDFEVLMERSMTDLPVEGVQYDGIRRAGIDGLRARGFFEAVGAATVPDGSITFVGLRTRQGHPQPIFRINSNAGVNYHAYVLKPSDLGTMIADVELAATGELLSETTRGILELNLASEPTVVAKLMGQKDTRLANAKTMQRVVALQLEQNYEAVLAELDKLPTPIQNSKAMLIARINAVTSLSMSSELIDASKRYEALYPSDSALALMMLDSSIETKDQERLAKCIRDLKEAYGDQVFLDCVYASGLMGMDLGEQALDVLRSIDLKSSDDLSAHSVAAAVANDVGDYDILLQELKYLQENGYVFGDLRLLPEYDKFVASPQFNEWATFTGLGN